MNGMMPLMMRGEFACVLKSPVISTR